MSRKPKVLFYDIETSYKIARVWREGKQYVNYDQIVPESKYGNIICICWKWEGERTIHSLDWGLRKQDSSKMIDKFTEVIESSDVVIAHNGDAFDLKHINTRRIIDGKPPINWPTTEDTLKMFRRHFKFASNRLDYLSRTLVGAGKDPMSFQDWIDIVEGKCPKALAKMIKYCKKDVKRLDQVYQMAKPFFTPKVNRSLIVNLDKSGCPSCGSKELIKRGYRFLRSGKYQVYGCKNCGHNFKGERIKALT